MPDSAANTDRTILAAPRLSIGPNSSGEQRISAENRRKGGLLRRGRRRCGLQSRFNCESDWDRPEYVVGDSGARCASAPLLVERKCPQTLGALIVPKLRSRMNLCYSQRATLGKAGLNRAEPESLAQRSRFIWDHSEAGGLDMYGMVIFAGRRGSDCKQTPPRESS